MTTFGQYSGPRRPPRSTSFTELWRENPNGSITSFRDILNLVPRDILKSKFCEDHIRPIFRSASFTELWRENPNGSITSFRDILNLVPRDVLKSKFCEDHIRPIFRSASFTELWRGDPNGNITSLRDILNLVPIRVVHRGLARESKRQHNIIEGHPKPRARKSTLFTELWRGDPNGNITSFSDILTLVPVCVVHRGLARGPKRQHNIIQGHPKPRARPHCSPSFGAGTQTAT
ncbi:hypothetical protein B0H13DRAFT_1862647 [Mycena leptocephala]|nr:hypothetical protein B0H13DRAFT_1862647 [Mycena leptocephala]